MANTYTPDLVNLVQEKMAAGEWAHPKMWTDEEWEAYFDKESK